MRLSHVSFFADFYIYPAAAVALVGLTIVTAPAQWVAWSLAALVLLGVGFWTFVEYLLHRYVLHHVPWIKEQHEAHHDNQKALIGTPTWLSLIVILAAVMLPAILISNLAIGSGLTAGLMLGYLWFVTVHYGVHHWNAKPDSYFYRLKRRHALHHHFDDMRNFGVTSGFWDYVFGTNVTVRRKSARD